MADGFSESADTPKGGDNGQSDADAILRAAQEAIAGLGASDPAPAAAAPAAPPIPFALPKFDFSNDPQAARAIELLSDVNLDVKIELGRTRMIVEDVLKLSEGAVIELDKLAGDPVDIFVNGRYVARGEVLVLNDNFCVRVNEIVPPNQASLTSS